MTSELLCGVDEAGRGPLAGAVFAAAVILHPERPISGLADSKKLSEKKRDFLAERIKQDALAWAVAWADVEEIDRLNILQASLLAMARAVAGLSVVPAKVMVDGLHCPPVPMASEAVVKGDSKVAEISAASILAKTARDAEMCRLNEGFPQYGFDRHKGYPTAEHLELLRLHGVSAVHRRSYAPVRKILQENEP
jgi:ribonuclease HII